jgi:hypothetical protein
MIQVEIHDGPPPDDSNLVFHYIARLPLTLVLGGGGEITVAPGQPLVFNQEAFNESPTLAADIDRLLCLGALEHYIHMDMVQP